MVSVHYDPLLFKLIARGDDRDEAIGADGGRRSTRCVVEGVRTTIPFLQKALEHPDVRAARRTQMVTTPRWSRQGAFNG